MTKEAYASYERQDKQIKENIKHEKSNIKKLEDKIKKAEDVRSAIDEAEGSIPTLETRIEECAKRKAVEDEEARGDLRGNY